MVYQSPMGPLCIQVRNGGVLRLAFGDDCNGCPDLSADRAEASEKAILNAACQWLDSYFAAHNPGPLPPLYLEGTPFQKKVWNALLSVPYGHTATYGQIARQIGCRSAQAVGQAVHNNPVAIIVPCHRIIGSNGHLTGYAAGLPIKSALLQLEGSALL